MSFFKKVGIYQFMYYCLLTVRLKVIIHKNPFELPDIKGEK